MNISVYSFTPSLQARAVMRDGEPWFVAADVCAALDYSDTSMTVRRLDEDERGTSSICTPFGDQQMLVINEAGLYSLILGSRKPEAKAFKKWVTSEVLPSIRKTGSYGQHVPNLTHSYTDAVAGVEVVARMLRIEGSAALGMVRKATEITAPHLLPILPVYAIDAPTGSGSVSSEATDSLSALMKAHDIKGTAASMNVRLALAGYLERKTREGKSGNKEFWSITGVGQEYGKNLTSPQNPRETQPHWYRAKFLELMDAVNNK